MTYEYYCEKCQRAFDVIKSVRQMEEVEHCSCGNVAKREFVPSRLHFIGTKVEHAEYNPGLGCIVHNSKHRKELAKQKGLEEIGNEPVKNIHKHFDKIREDNRQEAWEKADAGWVGNGE